jgi:hypothetical protein
MFSFDRPIFLMCVPTRHMMYDANFLEKEVEFLILSSPVSLYGNDFSREESLNKFLKFTKNLKDLTIEF